MELVVLAGLQGAGKSGFVRERLGTHAHVSKDRMPNNRRKEARQRELVAEALARGQSVVIDNTHPRRADRAHWIAYGHALGLRVVGYHLDAPLRECLARNARREGRARVPEPALLGTARRFEPLSLDEGFDALYRVRLTESGFEVRAAQ